MQIAEQLIAAQRDKSPEGRMRQGALLRQIIGSQRSLRAPADAKPVSRFLSKVAYGTSDCWLWVGSVNRLGYGAFPLDGETKAHRVSYRLFKGEIPAGLKVMHTCDTRNCVNPEHLVTGTQADNVADMVAKGRARTGDMNGARNPMAKATAEVVDKIRAAVAAGAKQIDLAREFGLSAMTVSRIVRKESWNV